MGNDYPIIYLDENGQEIKLRRDKFRDYHSEDGRAFKKTYVWQEFRFVRHDRVNTEYITTVNGFRVRAPKREKI